MKDRHGFTLIELLVVMAIISVLVGVKLPAVQGALAKGGFGGCSLAEAFARAQPERKRPYLLVAQDLVNGCLTTDPEAHQNGSSRRIDP